LGDGVKLHALPIAGANLVESARHCDARGAFMRLFCADELAEVIGARTVVQINHSRTTAVGAIRGLHFQHPPHAEMKLVRCLKGRVWDVMVDLRAGSPTFLHWHGEELSTQNARMMVIPEGCAHGFQVLDPDSELLYLHTAFYAPHAEAGLRYDDPRLGIAWPLPVTDISARDAGHAPIADDFLGITS
jgi:dTDP-4-dehydrorhamnose 3,5-epimerase